MRVQSEVTSLEGLVCLIVQLITHGYYFWVRGQVQNRRGLTAQEIDDKMVRKFNANLPKHRRPRERKKGKANVRYVRFGVDWFLFSTCGEHQFFDEHVAKAPGAQHEFNDIRDDGGAIRIHGYSIRLTRRGYAKKTPAEREEWQQARADWQRRRQEADSRGEHLDMLPRGRRHERWVGRVCIHRERYAELRAELLSLATHRRADYLAMRFWNVPFLPYKPIQQQLRSILRQVNKARQHVGYEPVSRESIRAFFNNVSPFQGSSSGCGSEEAGSKRPHAASRSRCSRDSA